MSSRGSSMDIIGPLLVEHRSLLDSIVACGAVEGVDNTIRAMGNYLSIHANEIRWFRMYSEYPPWQQLSGLLNQELDKDIVLRGKPTVFYTLISPRNRKDLHAGSWHSKGKGKVTWDQFVMTKLYYTDNPNRRMEDRLTLVEFALKMVHQHRVAICVLHLLDYRQLIQDLSHGTIQLNLPGNQANQVDVPQHMAPVNIAPAAAAGFMYGPQITYTNNESVGYGPALENNAVNQYKSTFPLNVAMYNMAPGNIEATNMGYHHSPQIYNPNASNTLLNDGIMYAMTSLGNIGMSVRHDPALPSNTLPVNNGMIHDMPLNTGYHNYPEINNMNLSNTWLNNGSMYATTPLGNIGMSVRFPQDPSNYVEDPSNTWYMNYAMRDTPLNVRNHPSPENHTTKLSTTLPNNGSMYGVTSLGSIGMLTEQDAQAGQMSRQNDTSITSSLQNMVAPITNQNSMARDSGQVQQTNFLPDAHLVTNEQNNNEEGYSLFLDYFLDYSSTIEEP